MKIEMNQHAKEAIAHSGLVLWAIAVLGASVYLSVHTGNYKWMLMMLLLLCTKISVNGDIKPQNKEDEQ